MMKRYFYYVIGCVISGAFLAAFFYYLQQPYLKKSEHKAIISAIKTERLIVRVKQDRDIKKIARKAGINLSEFVKKPGSNFYVVNVNPEQKRIITANKSIAFVETDEPVRIFLSPNDPRYPDQPNWPSVSADKAWDINSCASSVIVAIVDTGVNGQQEDLKDRVVGGYDYINRGVINSGEDSDDHGHGTQIAGVIAAEGNNSKGIAGADWRAKIMPVKALDSSGIGSTADAASAIRYAADNGAKIINLSFGRSSSSQTLEDAVNYAWGKGVLLVGASGNDGVSNVAYPAAYTNVVAVGALDGESRASFSDYGVDLDVMAPGKSILTTNDAQTEYSAVSGTSLAAPHVAGEAALILSVQPNFSVSELKNQILTATDRLAAMGNGNRTDEYGYGRVNFEKAISSLVDYRYNVIDQNAYPRLAVGESYQFSLRLQNTGNTIWGQSTVRLGTDGPMDRIPGFAREASSPTIDSGWLSENRVRMQQSEVRSGETATFAFWYTVPTGKPPGIYREYFRPVSEGCRWLQDTGIYWDVRVLSEAETYQSQLIDQNSNPTIQRGQAYNFTIQLKNTGKATWRRGRVNLGTDRGRDHIPSFVREDIVNNNPSGWIAENRVQFDGQTIAPGETATFSFWMSVPPTMTPGTYREHFRLVAEGITWMEDHGIYWDVTVQ